MNSSQTSFESSDEVVSSSTDSSNYENNIIIPTDYKILKDIYKEAMPSLGNVKALVVPIDFSSYPSNTCGYTLEDLRKVFFGTSDEVDWESVSSYYYKSSYGKLSISGDVLPWYRASRNASYYNNNSYDGVDILVKEAFDYHVKRGLNTSLYDSDNDGYIDAVYFIYSYPVDYDDYNSIWWAFQTDYLKGSDFNGRKLGKYVFAGLDFLNEVDGAFLDATTYIHETGHLLGLDDYYDYDDSIGPKGGLGYSDMMEYNVGDHNPLSKILLGWVKPKVIVGSTNINISPLLTNEDVILISNKWNNSLFDEYILIDLYTPNGLNTIQHITYSNDNCEVVDKNSYDACNIYLPPFTKVGARIYHVDAKLGSGSNYNGYFTMFSKNNSTTSTKFIKLIEADGRKDIETNTDKPFADNNDLFIDGKIFNLNIWNNYRLYDNQVFKYSVKFNDLLNNSYNIEINLK